MTALGSFEGGDLVVDDRIHWYMVRARAPRNRNRRKAVVSAKKELRRLANGQTCMRPVKGTGKRVFVHELILKRAGFHVFQPVKQEWRVVNSRTKEKALVSLPLFCDWFFVGWDGGESRFMDPALMATVIEVMGVGGCPQRIPTRRLSEYLADFGAKDLIAPKDQRFMRTGVEYKVGDEGLVVGGPFAEFPFRVTEVEGSRVRGLVRFFGRETAYETSARNVAKAV